MTRWAPPALLACVLFAGAAAAQTAQRSFPSNALRGEIAFGQPPELRLNGQDARLSPGARIRGRDNLLQMSASLQGQTAVVHYVLDPVGLVRDVWILTDSERARQPWPRTPREAQSWAFDPVAQTWTPR